MKNLKKDLLSGNIEPCYLFYGEEKYLIHAFEQQVITAVVAKGSEDVCLQIFEGAAHSALKIIDTADTVSLLGGRRLVIIKNSGLFATGRKEDAEQITAYLQNPNEQCVLLFIEEKVDKRAKLYKTAAKLGCCFEFSMLKENEVVAWIGKIAAGKGAQIGKGEAIRIARNLSGHMEAIEMEVAKLSAYKQGQGAITMQDIELLGSKTLESRIFDLVDAIGGKKAQEALTIYNNLLALKESPIMILSMIGRQFRLVFKSSVLAAGKVGSEAIAKQLGIRSFLVGSYLRQAKNFTQEELKGAVLNCMETDTKIKTGILEAELAVQLLIIKYAKAA